MGASQQNCINIIRLVKQLYQAIADDGVGNGKIKVVSRFHQGHPGRAGLLVNMQVWKGFPNLNHIRTRINGALCSKDTNMFCFSIVANDFGGGADHAEHPFAGVYSGKISLLNAAEGFG